MATLFSSISKPPVFFWVKWSSFSMTAIFAEQGFIGYDWEEIGPVSQRLQDHKYRGWADAA